MKRCFLVLFLSLSAAWSFQPIQRSSCPVSSQPRASRLSIQQTCSTKRMTTKVWMSEETGNGELVEQRKILTMVGYRFASLVYLFLGLFVLVWQGSRSLSLLPSASYDSAGPVLAAGVSYVLEGAAVNDRLTSETFKRLNLFLAKYGAAWLLAAYLIRNTGSRIVTNPIVITASVVTVFNCVRAWTFGVKGWEKRDNASRLRDLASTIRKHLKVMFTINNFPGAVYLSGALLFSGLKVAKLIEVFQMLASGGVGATVCAKEIFRIALYSLLGAVMVTLKDGGDRDRLTGSSYVELNTVATFVLMAIGVYFYNLGSIAFGAASAFLCFYTGTMGFLTFREKREALL